MHPAPGVRSLFVAACLTLFAQLMSHQAFAQATPQPRPIGVSITGRLEHPGSLDLAALQALPVVTLEVGRATPQGPRTLSFAGASLWSLISAATPIHEAGPHSALRHTIFAQGRDGYIVAVAIGELDPEFEGKQVLVAYAQDGKPLPDLRLVVPGDKRAGRSVRDLVSIEVR